jgi:uncharacterized protein (TIGR02453 family)
MDSTTRISADTLGFLTELKANNHKEWFSEHKSDYQTAHGEVKGFMETLQTKMEVHDAIEKLKMFRIYRDVRFSADKTPYKMHLSGHFVRAGAALRGGYYVHIQPGGSFIATGFWAPEKADLLRIRKELELDASEFKEVLANPALKKAWGELQGDGVKTAPKGFSKEHPDIELIRKKQFIFVKNFSDKAVVSANFQNQINDAFEAIRPFLDLMSAILTTDLNGESLLD